MSINTSIKMVNKYDDRKTKNDIETNKDTELLNEASTLSDGDTEDQSTELVDDNKMCQKYFLDKSTEYDENNFENEHDVTRHFEDHYETEYLSNFNPFHEPKEISAWLKDMDQKLDFIYNYENNARNRNESFNDCLCDPFTSLDKRLSLYLLDSLP